MKKAFYFLREGQNGAVVLTTTLVILVLLSLLTTAMVHMAKASVDAGFNSRQRTAALYVAESGIEEAIYRLNNDETISESQYPTDSPSFESEEGLLDENSFYQVWLQQESENRYHLYSKGVKGERFRVVEVTLFFDRQVVVFPEPGFITLEPNDHPACENSDEVPCYMSDYQVIPYTIDLPQPGIASEGPLHLEGEEEQTLGPGQYRFDEISLEEESSLYIQGDATIYIDGNVTAEDESEIITEGSVKFYVYGESIRFDEESSLTSESGQVEIYTHADITLTAEEDGEIKLKPGAADEDHLYISTSGNLNMSEESVVGNEDAPANTVFFLSTDSENKTISLEEESVFYGGIYAPTGELLLKEESVVEGAFVAEDAETEEEIILIYDPDLRELAFPEEGQGGGGSWGIAEGSWQTH